MAYIKSHMKQGTFHYLMIGLIFLLSCGDDNIKDPENGDLSNTFNNNNAFENDPIKQESQYDKEQKQLRALKIAGYESSNIEKGNMPNCYNFKPIYSSVDNYLQINVGNNTDVAVKVMNAESEDCIRFVYVNSNSSFKIKNIPEGIFYLKIAYGQDWYSKNENGQCIGKFITNPLYEKGEDLMDFNIQRTARNTNTPSFQLDLDVITTDYINSFDTKNISEDEFNN